MGQRADRETDEYQRRIGAQYPTATPRVARLWPYAWRPNSKVKNPAKCKAKKAD
jgi:hypothetical protein